MPFPFEPAWVLELFHSVHFVWLYGLEWQGDDDDDDTDFVPRPRRKRGRNEEPAPEARSSKRRG